MLSGIEDTDFGERPMTKMPVIAIVDNDQDGRDVLHILLKSEGYTVHTFTGGKDLLATFKPKLFRLILMDLVMPDMDGYELSAIVRGQDPSVPLIAVTASGYDTDRERAHMAGFSDFITKPFVDFPAFLDRIVKYLQENSN
jgi:CheY-like chemotaxis protein